MTVAFWCVLIVIVLPVVCAAIAKFGSGRFALRDNHNPRDFLDRLEGLPRRAHAAQQNSFEAIPGFAAGVIIAHVANVAELVTIDVLAVLFVTSRLLYIIFYLTDLAALRSLVWFIGFGLVIALFGISI
ncbi:MAPEG family protein [Pseudomonas sp. NPDC090202]|uniref:MAPEG family protein n=1 Tax=unclassified Pseudomonas TaxID=196821 RepID=UPI0037F71FFB